jgi:hypothetical protein
MGFLNDGVAGKDLTAVSTDASETVGALFTGSDGVYQYAKAEGAITAGWAAIIDENGDATAATTTLSGSLPCAIGIACATLADEEYGWFWRGCGVFEAIVTNGAAAGALTTTASDGILGTGGDAVSGARNVDAGVTATRVTIFASTLMATNS